MGEHGSADLVSKAFPTLARSLHVVGGDCAGHPIGSNPDHHLRMGEVAALASHLPEPVVWLVPLALQVVHQRDLERPRIGGRVEARRRRETATNDPHPGCRRAPQSMRGSRNAANTTSRRPFAPVPLERTVVITQRQNHRHRRQDHAGHGGCGATLTSTGATQLTSPATTSPFTQVWPTFTWARRSGASVNGSSSSTTRSAAKPCSRRPVSAPRPFEKAEPAV